MDLTSSPRTFGADRPRGWRRLLRLIVAGWALAAWALNQGAGAATCPDAIPPLVSAAQVQRLGACVRIVDLRDADDGGWADGHIPGALSAPYAAWRGPAEDPGALLPVARYTELVRGLGLELRRPVVLVADGGDPSDFGAPARVYWTLKWLGFAHPAILNGGMSAWNAAHLPVTRAAAAVAPSRVEPRPQPQWLATRAQIAAAPRAAVLLDARPAAFYLGQAKAPAAWQPGTLPGAVNFDNTRWFPDGGGSLPDAATLARIAAQLPGAADGARPVVSFCNTGHWAATNWFVLSELLGRRDVRLYPGSMVDWSRAGEPMDHVPTRLQQLWAQIRPS